MNKQKQEQLAKQIHDAMHGLVDKCVVPRTTGLLPNAVLGAAVLRDVITWAFSDPSSTTTSSHPVDLSALIPVVSA